MLPRSFLKVSLALKTATAITASTFCLTVAVGGGAQAASLVDSVNADKSPLNTFTSVTQIGWSYTPTSSYALSGINTKFFGFSGVDKPEVRVEVYDQSPTSGGTILRSAIFTGLANQFSGGTFQNLNLQAGQSYFIAFQNLGGLIGSNITNDVGATSLGISRFGFNNDGSFSFSESGTASTKPILQFIGEPATAVPTPALLPGLIGLGVGVWRKRKTEQAEELVE